MPNVNEFVSMVIGFIEVFGGKIIFAAAAVIILGIGALTYIADRVFSK